jgi:hypothetical protein
LLELLLRGIAAGHPEIRQEHHQGRTAAEEDGAHTIAPALRQFEPHPYEQEDGTPREKEDRGEAVAGDGYVSTRMEAHPASVTPKAAATSVVTSRRWARRDSAGH